jgi:hypothetical protein
MPWHATANDMEDGLAAVGGALVLGAVSLWVAGPLGMLACGLALLVAGTVGSSTDGTGTDSGTKVNCPECGAVNRRGDDRCGYCEAEFEVGADDAEGDGDGGDSGDGAGVDDGAHDRQ